MIVSDSKEWNYTYICEVAFPESGFWRLLTITSLSLNCVHLECYICFHINSKQLLKQCWDIYHDDKLFDTMCDLLGYRFDSLAEF